MTRDEAVAHAVSLLATVFEKTLPLEEVHRKLAKIRAYHAGLEGADLRVDIWELVEEAKTDKIAFDALGLVAAELVGAGRELDWPLKRWTMKVLRGELARPKRQGKQRGINFYRDIGIRSVIVEIVELGFHPTRGVETQQENSACDIVAAAMVKMRKVPQRYDQMKDIFNMVGWGLI